MKILGPQLFKRLAFLVYLVFFVYRLISEKVPGNSLKENTKNKSLKPVKKVSTVKKGLFGRNKKVEQITDVKKIDNKKRVV